MGALSDLRREILATVIRPWYREVRRGIWGRCIFMAVWSRFRSLKTDTAPELVPTVWFSYSDE